MPGVSKEYKDVRTTHKEKQKTLHNKDFRKGKQIWDRKPWKESKGWGTRSGHPTMPGRNYGYQERHHGPSRKLCEINTAEEWESYDADAEREEELHQTTIERSYGEPTDTCRSSTCEVQLMDIVHPARTRNGKRTMTTQYPANINVGRGADVLSEIYSAMTGTDFDQRIDFVWDCENETEYEYNLRINALLDSVVEEEAGSDYDPLLGSLFHTMTEVDEESERDSCLGTLLDSTNLSHPCVDHEDAERRILTSISVSDEEQIEDGFSNIDCGNSDVEDEWVELSSDDDYLESRPSYAQMIKLEIT